MPEPHLALSVKQPWAALIAAGRKTVEVRTWPTARRGPILIHASKLPDPRPEAWASVDTPALRELAGRAGGVIGVADLTDCVLYSTAEAFAADRDRHSAPGDWFHPPGLFGFRLTAARPVRFHPVPGNTFFFKVMGVELTPAGSTPLGRITVDMLPEGKLPRRPAS